MNVGVILAAGVGKRFKSDKPKQFFLLNGKPVLYYAVRAFVDSGLFDQIVIVLSRPYRKLVERIIERYFSGAGNLWLCEGGATRQDSLYNGVLFMVDKLGSEDFKVVSHCAVRPLVPGEVLRQNLELTERGKSVDTVRRVYDTMLYTGETGETGFIDRDRLFTGLTPQSFYAADYLAAYAAVRDYIGQYTCACSLMQGAGYGVKLLITEQPIHKITVREDITIVKQQLKELV
jgi:2-C-methyl-D-erythritol 4-phosphate cytidylyltransferase